MTTRRVTWFKVPRGGRVLANRESAMATYIFIRGNGFYPIDLGDDTDAIRNAACNPGTQVVQKVVSGGLVKTIWEARTAGQSAPEGK